MGSGAHVSERTAIWLQAITAAISQANHALPFEAILLAMLLEQASELERLRRLLNE